MSKPQHILSGLAVVFLCLVTAAPVARAQALIGGNGLNGGFNNGFGGAVFNNGFGGAGFNNGFGGFNGGFAVGGGNNGFGGGFAFGSPVIGGGFNTGFNNFGGAVGFGAGPGFVGSGGGYMPPVFNTQPTTYNNLNGLGLLIDQHVVQKRTSTLPPVRRRRR